MDIKELIFIIEGILLEEGLKRGGVIRYTPTEVGDILRKHAEELSN